MGLSVKTSNLSYSYPKRSVSPTIDVVVAGYLGIDFAPGFPKGVRQSDKLFRPGALIQTNGLSISLGGAVPNVGLALKKFGRQVELMGCIGTDSLGSVVSTLLSTQGITKGIWRKRSAGTAYGIVLAPAGVDRMFYEDPGCNAMFGYADLDYDLIRKSRLFHFGYPPLMERLWRNQGAELKKMLMRVRRMGVATSLDMSLPDGDSPAGKADWRAILCEALPSVDIFVPSLEETLFMLEPALYRRTLQALDGRDMCDAIPEGIILKLGHNLLSMGVSVAMIKVAHRGAYFFTKDVTRLATCIGAALPRDNWNRRIMHALPCSVDRSRVCNASGAGDCAVAGFLAALLSGAEIERAAQYAMRAGRDNLYGSDAYSGLSDWTSMTRQLEQPKIVNLPPLS